MTGETELCLQDIKAICSQRGLFDTPSLNSKLLLHGCNISKVPSLQPYSNLRCLFLNDNSISYISSLEHLRQLSSLYIQNNRISCLGGLSQNVDLRVIDVSNNRITSISSISHLPHLTNLNLSNNHIRTLDMKAKEEVCNLSLVCTLCHASSCQHVHHWPH